MNSVLQSDIVVTITEHFIYFIIPSVGEAGDVVTSISFRPCVTLCGGALCSWSTLVLMFYYLYNFNNA